jgi:hypothetical protein
MERLLGAARDFPVPAYCSVTPQFPPAYVNQPEALVANEERYPKHSCGKND